LPISSSFDSSCCIPEVQNTVSDLIEKGTKIMMEWAKMNTQHLLKDHCSTISTKAPQSLDGLTSYNTEVNLQEQPAETLSNKHLY
jgi:hypothetical protein